MRIPANIKCLHNRFKNLSRHHPPVVIYINNKCKLHLRDRQGYSHHRAKVREGENFRGFFGENWSPISMNCHLSHLDTKESSPQLEVLI